MRFWRANGFRWPSRRRLIWMITTWRLGNLASNFRSFLRWLKLIWPNWKKRWRLRGRRGLRGGCRSGVRNKNLAADLRGFSQILSIGTAGETKVPRFARDDNRFINTVP